MPTHHQLILCTCPDRDTADKIARLLVTGQLAACVNILPGILSVYTWQGQVESAQEHLLLIKSSKDRYQALEAAIRDNHPYDVPEIIAVPVEAGLPEYLHWIDSCLSSK
ncbi:MAG: divalent-cation tolerance protein CutA [Methylobacter sp.]|uniref:divalent-cation tolerance protein CutA n=1 Tax=unclassified Methylobacter TaxID=2635283 RepID=UPI00056384D2|nr:MULTISPECIES: divalent-cation tolerance protein CutA [unclassified Methylobacter]MCL7420343.1 divalent-cation tolerance protein CutA [Methylobacter sp.]